MTFAHKVKYNGKWYLPGETILEDTFVEKAEEEVGEKVVAVSYTKTEINRMSTADLKALAEKENIPNASEMTGADIKKCLIEHFGL